MIRIKTYLTCLLAAVLIFSLWPQAAIASGTTVKSEPYGVILSWSENPASTQTVTWSASWQGEGKVQYAEAAAFASDSDFGKAKEVRAACTEVAANSLYRFEGVMRDLKPDTLYRYRVGNGNGSSTIWSKSFVFRTAPKSSDVFQFMYFGDVQFEIRDEDYTIWGALISDACRKYPKIRFALSGGDYVNSSANTKDWNSFLSAAEPVFSGIPMMTVPGNHETSILPSYYLKMFGLPKNGPAKMPEEFYSFDYGNCHFVQLNTCIFMPERKNYIGESAWKKLIADTNQWICKDIEASKAEWVIVSMHHPAYGINTEEDDAIYKLIRDNWAPIFEKEKVDLVFCGHQHASMRTGKIKGVTYVIGNSGQKRSNYYDQSKKPDYIEFIDIENSTWQLVSVNGKTLELSTLAQDGKVLDKVEMIH